MSDEDLDVQPDMIYEGENLDPLSDAEAAHSKNRAKVGSARPSSLLYTYGPGAIMDLPGFSVMPAGLDDWEPIWSRRSTIPKIRETRLLRAVQTQLGRQVNELRPFPWQPRQSTFSKEGHDLGIPARVFPQWLRCTGCDYLGPLPRFHYTNEHPYRPDLARFTHRGCPGRSKTTSSKQSPAVPAPYLLTCTNGHLDEFPYRLWVHEGNECSRASHPDLKMLDASTGRSLGATIECQACAKRRSMFGAQGQAGKTHLPPRCRGRHPHLDAYDPDCDAAVSLIMMGASNLWFAVTQSVIVMPRTDEEPLSDRLRTAFDREELTEYHSSPITIRALSKKQKIDLSGVTDEDLTAAVTEALAPVESHAEWMKRRESWDPVDLLVPEWRYLQKPTLFPRQQNTSGLMVTEMERGASLNPKISRVVAVNRMKKVNALIGFTRLDQVERVSDRANRLVKLTRTGRPTWVPATEDRGEGIFLQLDMDEVQAWESQILTTTLWAAHREAHRRNFANRFSETAGADDPDSRLPAPRYWLLHTFAHVLLREMAMSCGYGAASLAERIYAWPQSPVRQAAAGLLICTTASDSEGTLGGLVAMSEPERLQSVVRSALSRASRCSSDPVCAVRTPSGSEDFLHGAACHCCCFASETSCERANRFLDRRFLLDLPVAAGSDQVPGFFGSPGVR